MDITTIIIIAVILAVVGAGLAYYLATTNKVKKEGIEAEATVSRVDREVTNIVDNESGLVDSNTSKTFYVKYKTAEGEEVEAVLSNPTMRQKYGDVIKIKYLPERPTQVVRIKE